MSGSPRGSLSMDQKFQYTTAHVLGRPNVLGPDHTPSIEWTILLTQS